MSLLRTTLSIVGITGLSLGYAASQWAFFNGEAAAFSSTVGQAPVKWAALALLILAVGLACFPEKEGDGS